MPYIEVGYTDKDSIYAEMSKIECKDLFDGLNKLHAKLQPVSFPEGFSPREVDTSRSGNTLCISEEPKRLC